MNIVEIIPSLFPVGGAERLVCNLTESFLNNNHSVVLISLYSNEHNIVVDELKNKGVRIIFLNKKKGVDFSCAKRLKKIISEINPDVIHAHLDSLLTIYLSKIYRKYNVFYTFHTLITENVVGKKTNPKNLLYKHMFKKRMVTPVAISKTIKKSISSYYGLTDNFIQTIYNGVPVSLFSSNKPLEERAYDFVFIGRFIKIKNPDIILLSFIDFCKSYPKSSMIFVGEGELLPLCKEIVNKEKISNVIFTGFVDDVSSYLSNSKVLILASEYEGNPIVINEAIASKCFVLATKVGGIPDVINDNNGMLIDFDKQLKSKLTESMSYCKTHIVGINDMLDRNYQSNIENVSIERTCKEYLQLFNGGKL